MDIATVLISGLVGAVTSAITAYFTSKLKVSEERAKWSRELSQKYAEALATNPEIASKMARQFGIALIVFRPLEDPDAKALGKFFLVPNSRHVVGRAPDCEIVLHHSNVSRHHAAFFADDEHVFIHDMGAHHPALVNGKPARGRVRLRSGDHVSIGGARFDVTILT